MGMVNNVEWKGPAIIVGGLLATCLAISLFTPMWDNPWQNVIAEDGSYGVRVNMHNPLDRCLFPILTSYEWAKQAEQVTGIEVCE